MNAVVEQPPRHPPLEGRRVRLRAVHPTDYDYLFALVHHPDAAFRWRARGSTVSFEEHVGALWHDVL